MTDACLGILAGVLCANWLQVLCVAGQYHTGGKTDYQSDTSFTENSYCL